MKLRKHEKHVSHVGVCKDKKPPGANNGFTMSSSHDLLLLIIPFNCENLQLQTGSDHCFRKLLHEHFYLIFYQALT